MHIIVCITGRLPAVSTTLKNAAQLGEIIKAARKEQKITQQTLADFTGLHRNAIAHVEAGTSEVRLGTLLRLAELLRLRITIAGDAE